MSLKSLNFKSLNQTKMKTNNRKRYETPQVEVIEIEPQGMLCASGGVAATYADGGTESMTMVEIDWP